MDLNKIQQLFPQAKQNITLFNLTSIKIGGLADVYIEIDNFNDLEKLKDLKLNKIILGGGSNIIFHQNGFRGAIIKIKSHKIKVEENKIIAESGTMLSKIVQIAKKNNLTGIEELTGLPGTIGGAIRGNAGAFGVEIKDILEKITVFSEENGIYELTKEDLNFSYRNSRIKESKGKEIILSAVIKLKKTTEEEAKIKQKKILEAIKQRQKTQPRGNVTGSFFKNPSKEQTAGELLDKAGCKGLTIGGATISDLHANWIINKSNATQEDIIQLAKTARNKVKDKFKITLEPEVQLIGEKEIIEL